jgi:hypothetical protein
VDTLDYPVGTLVRLVESLEEVPAGAEGVVIGYYRTERPAYAVTVEGRTSRIPPACLIAIDADGRVT